MPRQLRPARRGSGAASGRKASLPFHSPELRRRQRAGARTRGRPGTDPGRSEEMVAGHHRRSEGGGGDGWRRVCAVLNGGPERAEIHDVGNRREYSQLTTGPRKHTIPYQAKNSAALRAMDTVNSGTGPRSTPVPTKTSALAGAPSSDAALLTGSRTPPAQTTVVADIRKSRRRIVWTAISAFLITNFLMFLRFFFPRTLLEPSTKFRIGYPSDFGPGVDERFKQSHRVWVVRRPDRLFVIYGKCTHLGCTPNWIESENKFKCPGHGSGHDMEGRHFEGPAPRPMDRAFVELDAEGQIVVDTSRLSTCPPGGECQFETNPNSYLIVSRSEERRVGKEGR